MKLLEKTVAESFDQIVMVKETGVYKMPKVSVIMPVYNAERYITYAVESILHQEFSDFELIIIDDKGTDNSICMIEKMKDPRIRIIENDSNRGIAYARNRGLEAACGEYIALMDDDDWTPPHRLRLENDFLDANMDISAVGGAMHTIDEYNRLVKYNNGLVLHQPGRVKAELIFHDVIANGSTMFRKSIVEAHSIKYQDNMHGMEDYRFWIDYSMYGKIVNMDDVLLYWRASGQNESAKNKSLLQSERRDTFGKIQEYALEKHGFYLTEEELKCFKNSFVEDEKAVLTRSDLEQLYYVMEKIMEQGSEKDFAGELNFVCRYMYGRRVAYSDIWTGRTAK